MKNICFVGYVKRAGTMAWDDVHRYDCININIILSFIVFDGVFCTAQWDTTIDCRQWQICWQDHRRIMIHSNHSALLRLKSVERQSILFITEWCQW